MTGWPWPLDAVQGWFEALWQHISNAATSAVSAVYGWIHDAVSGLWNSIVNYLSGVYWWFSAKISRVYDAVVEGLGSLWQSLVDYLSGVYWWFSAKISRVYDAVVEGLGNIWKSLVLWVGGVFQQVSSMISNVYTAVVEGLGNLWKSFVLWVGGLWDGLVTVLGDLWNNFVIWGDSLVVGINTMFDCAAETIGNTLGPLIEGLGSAFVASFNYLFASISSYVSRLAESAVKGLRGAAAFLRLASPKLGNYLTPEAARDYLEAYADSGYWDFIQVESTMLVAEMVSLGQVDITLAEFMKNPATAAYASLIEEIMATEHRSGMIPAYRYFCLNKYKPLIPPLQDIIRMVVREAFLPEMVVEAPAVFTKYMGYLGYASDWADRYWTAHFEPIALRQAYENLWRGFWDKKRFMYALHIADIHPTWREDIYNVAFGPPSVRELGYGYDTGLYSVEDIVKYRRMGGLSPEDAEKSGRAMVAYRTEAERNALRREAIYDYTDGLDTEEELRGKLAAIGGRPEIIDLWVARAKYRYDRDAARDLIKIVQDQFVKGYMDEVALRSELLEIGVKPERAQVLVVQAQTRRLVKLKEETAEKKRLLTEAKVAKAWELGLIGDAEYVSRVVDIGYTEEDARLMLEVRRTPVPITAEEIERRRASIQARINRAKRRYEKLIAGLDERTGLISGEIESLEAERVEVLDVIDVEIRSIEDELAGITPEVLTKPILEAIDRVRRRYERSLLNVNRRETLLKDDITATERLYAETVDVIDTSIKYVEEELLLLGAVP